MFGERAVAHCHRHLAVLQRSLIKLLVVQLPVERRTELLPESRTVVLEAGELPPG